MMRHSGQEVRNERNERFVRNERTEFTRELFAAANAIAMRPLSDKEIDLLELQTCTLTGKRPLERGNSSEDMAHNFLDPAVAESLNAIDVKKGFNVGVSKCTAERPAKGEIDRLHSQYGKGRGKGRKRINTLFEFKADINATVSDVQGAIALVCHCGESVVTIDKNIPEHTIELDKVRQIIFVGGTSPEPEPGKRQTSLRDATQKTITFGFVGKLVQQLCKGESISFTVHDGKLIFVNDASLYRRFISHIRLFVIFVRKAFIQFWELISVDGVKQIVDRSGIVLKALLDMSANFDRLRFSSPIETVTNTLCNVARCMLPKQISCHWKFANGSTKNANADFGLNKEQFLDALRLLRANPDCMTTEVMREKLFAAHVKKNNGDPDITIPLDCVRSVLAILNERVFFLPDLTETPVTASAGGGDASAPIGLPSGSVLDVDKFYLVTCSGNGKNVVRLTGATHQLSTALVAKDGSLPNPPFVIGLGPDGNPAFKVKNDKGKMVDAPKDILPYPKTGEEIQMRVGGGMVTFLSGVTNAETPYPFVGPLTCTFESKDGSQIVLTEEIV